MKKLLFLMLQYATVKINDETVASRAISQKISLPVGTTRIRTVVRAESGATKTYILAVTRKSKLESSLTDTLKTENITINAFKTVEPKPIIIYPNPTVVSFNLKITNGDAKNKVSLTVRNLQGKIIYQTTGNVHDTYTFGQNFAPGIYIAEIANGKIDKQVKIIKTAD